MWQSEALQWNPFLRNGWNLLCRWNIANAIWNIFLRKMLWCGVHTPHWYRLCWLKQSDNENTAYTAPSDEGAVFLLWQKNWGRVCYNQPWFYKVAWFVFTTPQSKPSVLPAPLTRGAVCSMVSIVDLLQISLALWNDNVCFYNPSATSHCTREAGG